jgi:peptidoglycan hydrolase-like protein with peptidoglycan-binding domain
MGDIAATRGNLKIPLGAGVTAFAIFGIAACSTSSSSTSPAIVVTVETTAPAAETRTVVSEQDRPTPTSTATAPATMIEPPAPVPKPAEIQPVAAVYVAPAPVAVPPLEVPLVAVGRSDGPETIRIQERMLELGFWVQGTDGDFGLTTTQAVMAFQKYHGIPANGSVDEQTATMMSAAADRANGLADAGTLVEIDKSRQLLFLVVDGTTKWAFNSSTGTEVPYETVNDKDPTKIERGDSVTPVGLYHTERERPEGWWAGDLGEIYRPKYFVGGIAVHGSNSIPNYPASHGCVRVSVPAMDFIWESNAIPLGTNVWVHGEIPAA